MKQNPFKVGDRLRVYSNTISSVLPIHKIHGEFIEFNCVPIKYHWKQCRRLKPKMKKKEPPKEVFCTFYETNVGNVRITATDSLAFSMSLAIGTDYKRACIKYIRTDE